MSNVVQFPGPGAFTDRRWAREKAEATIETLVQAVRDLESRGVDPQVLRPVVWNATKLAAWALGTEWSVDMAEQVLAGRSPTP